jgi:hypothetical protein
MNISAREIITCDLQFTRATKTHPKAARCLRAYGWRSLKLHVTFSRTLQHSASYKARKQEILDYIVITIKVLFLESLQLT